MTGKVVSNLCVSINVVLTYITNYIFYILILVLYFDVLSEMIEARPSLFPRPTGFGSVKCITVHVYIIRPVNFMYSIFVYFKVVRCCKGSRTS
jgi:hypothetical protein